MSIVLGITGGVATGKTTVMGMFRELGAETLSADEIARDVLAPGTPEADEVIRQFGPSVLSSDGNIDRRKLGELVFSNSEAKQSLESITHPRIIAILEQRINEFRKRATCCVALAVEIPLLVECKLMPLVDKVLVVTTEQETQIIRLKTRGFSTNEALRRINAQMPMGEKLCAADIVIRTDVSFEDTRRQVERAWEEAKRQAQ